MANSTFSLAIGGIPPGRGPSRRERWFFAQGQQRRGPIPFDQLIQSLLAQADARAPLVWRKGFADWTRAEDVPEVDRRIAPVLARYAVAEAGRRPPVASMAQARNAPATLAEGKPGSPLLVYGGLAGGVVVLGLVAWLFWPRSTPATTQQHVPIGGPSAESAPAVVIRPTPRAASAAAAITPTPAVSPRLTPSPAPTSAVPALTVLADRESDLPPTEVRKLRGVAVWSEENLELSLYNGTAWRVTGLYVRVSRLAGDDLVEDPRPLLLVPRGEEVAPAVAELLSRVAPDRKKPGLNSLDTGRFEIMAGAQPASFRWEIESARGYGPR